MVCFNKKEPASFPRLTLLVRSVADVRTLTCALYHVFYGAINAISTFKTGKIYYNGTEIQGASWVQVGYVVNVSLFGVVFTTTENQILTGLPKSASRYILSRMKLDNYQQDGQMYYYDPAGTGNGNWNAIITNTSNVYYDSFTYIAQEL